MISIFRFHKALILLYDRLSTLNLMLLYFPYGLRIPSLGYRSWKWFKNTNFGFRPCATFFVGMPFFGTKSNAPPTVKPSVRRWKQRCQQQWRRFRFASDSHITTATIYFAFSFERIETARSVKKNKEKGMEKAKKKRKGRKVWPGKWKRKKQMRSWKEGTCYQKLIGTESNRVTRGLPAEISDR